MQDIVAGGRRTTLKKTSPITLLKTRGGAPTIDKGGPDRSRDTGGDPDGSKADEVNHLLDEPRETDSPRKVVPTGSHPAFNAAADRRNLRAGRKPGGVNAKAQLTLDVFSNKVVGVNGRGRTPLSHDVFLDRRNIDMQRREIVNGHLELVEHRVVEPIAPVYKSVYRRNRGLPKLVGHPASRAILGHLEASTRGER